MICPSKTPAQLNPAINRNSVDYPTPNRPGRNVHCPAGLDSQVLLGEITVFVRDDDVTVVRVQKKSNSTVMLSYAQSGAERAANTETQTYN